MFDVERVDKKPYTNDEKCNGGYWLKNYVKAPSKLAKTSAEEDPRKTANGLFEVPLMVKVASWVLSPNSAMKTVKKVDSNKLKTIYK